MTNPIAARICFFNPAAPSPRIAPGWRGCSDILFTTGGELRLPGTINETIHLPEAAEELAGGEGLQDGLMRFLASRDPDEITGCVLVSLLTNQKPEIKPTLAPVKIEDALAHYRHLTELGIQPARLQMSGWFVPEESISAVRDAKKVAEEV